MQGKPEGQPITIRVLQARAVQLLQQVLPRAGGFTMSVCGMQPGPGSIKEKGKPCLFVLVILGARKIHTATWAHCYFCSSTEHSLIWNSIKTRRSVRDCTHRSARVLGQITMMLSCTGKKVPYCGIQHAAQGQHKHCLYQHQAADTKQIFRVLPELTQLGSPLAGHQCGQCLPSLDLDLQ